MRIRIYFQKTSAMRYTGHLDLHKAWERTFRRSNLPLAYTQGFHPQPRINLACALPLGFTSQAEIMDAWLESEMTVESVLHALTQAVPPGMVIESINEIVEPEPAIQVQVQSAVYEIILLEYTSDLDQSIENLLAAFTLPRERRGKPYDLRPLIEWIQRLPDHPDGWQRIQVQLAARESATGRPEEVAQAMGLNPHFIRVHRMQILLASSLTVSTPIT